MRRTQILFVVSEHDDVTVIWKEPTMVDFQSRYRLYGHGYTSPELKYPVPSYRELYHSKAPTIFSRRPKSEYHRMWRKRARLPWILCSAFYFSMVISCIKNSLYLAFILSSLCNVLFPLFTSSFECLKRCILALANVTEFDIRRRLRFGNACVYKSFRTGVYTIITS